jgi:hypothetical protein
VLISIMFLLRHIYIYILTEQQQGAYIKQAVPLVNVSQYRIDCAEDLQKRHVRKDHH